MAFLTYGNLITFVICARWTGDIYLPCIKLSDCPYVRISSIATELMSSPYSDTILLYNILTD